MRKDKSDWSITQKAGRCAFYALTLCAGAALIQGCAAMPDTTITTAALNVEAGYANTQPAGKAAAVAAKAVKVAKVAKASNVSATAYLGKAPYICTPSGFGRTSSCFLRAS
ncbi:hypothetical protein [Chelativorans sp. Marseille-P2723]|uniref:hypothetical protein n=1 Tax=Chelativorans sp. Marseille-P2723 TaxID=2709133 RepID=UPI00156E55E5|nr:hypothetical protein [Chelativorans sp. Marseille-P2723]